MGLPAIGSGSADPDQADMMGAYSSQYSVLSIPSIPPDTYNNGTLPLRLHTSHLTLNQQNYCALMWESMSDTCLSKKAVDATAPRPDFEIR